MCLTIHNQLTLLHNLLYEQITLRTDNIEEYYQIKKTIQMIIKNKTIEKELHAILPEIYSYGIEGERVSSFDEHIRAYEHKIPIWLQLIEESKTKICS